MISYYLSIVKTEEERDKITYIYNNFRPYMCYAVSQVIKDNRYDVEDMVHEAMLKIIENIDIIDMTDEIRARNLCSIIAKNKAKDKCRSKSSQVVSYEALLTEANDPASTPDEIVITKDTYQVIVKALRSLDEKYRDICTLKYLHHLKEREIALILDMSPKTVSTRIFRGKHLLREQLRKENIHV